jgi:hypothetical protein
VEVSPDVSGDNTGNSGDQQGYDAALNDLQQQYDDKLKKDAGQ